jgi:hypothetical protein
VAATAGVGDRLRGDRTDNDPCIRKQCRQAAQQIIGASIGTFNPCRGCN